jgi:hypothetical protein
MAVQTASNAAETAWRNLGWRVQARFITAIDVLSILLLDGVILAGGYGVIRLTEYLSDSASTFFEAARQLSAGLFLLLYAVTVCFHVVRFIKQELRS